MKTTVFVKLEIEGGKDGDAFAEVDNVLDMAVLQDAINENPNLIVRSAISGGASHVQEWLRDLVRG